jgi:hypothetical protein
MVCVGRAGRNADSGCNGPGGERAARHRGRGRVPGTRSPRRPGCGHRRLPGRRGGGHGTGRAGGGRGAPDGRSGRGGREVAADDGERTRSGRGSRAVDREEGAPRGVRETGRVPPDHGPAPVPPGHSEHAVGQNAQHCSGIGRVTEVRVSGKNVGGVHLMVDKSHMTVGQEPAAGAGVYGGSCRGTAGRRSSAADTGGDDDGVGRPAPPGGPGGRTVGIPLLGT